LFPPIPKLYYYKNKKDVKALQDEPPARRK